MEDSLHIANQSDRPLFDSHIIHSNYPHDKKIEMTGHTRPSRILHNLLPAVKLRSSFSRKREQANSESAWKLPESFPKVKGLYETFKKNKIDQNHDPLKQARSTQKVDAPKTKNRNQIIAQKFPYLFK